MLKFFIYFSYCKTNTAWNHRAGKRKSSINHRSKVAVSEVRFGAGPTMWQTASGLGFEKEERIYPRSPEM